MRTPIWDAFGMLMRLDASERNQAAFTLAETYPIVDLVRLCAHVKDPVVLAIFAWVVQRRSPACEAFEALLECVEDDVLVGALERLWAVDELSKELTWTYAHVLGVREMNVSSASQAALCLLERGAQPLAVARVLTRSWSDDDVLRALHENAIGYEHAVCLLHCARWTAQRIVEALARTELLAFERRNIMKRFRLSDA